MNLPKQPARKILEGLPECFSDPDTRMRAAELQKFLNDQAAEATGEANTESSLGHALISLFEKGEAKAQRLGRIEGKRAIIKRQIFLKFGDAAAAARYALVWADSDRLDELGDRILIAESFEDLISG